jgi:hypothetical protein
LRLIGDIHGDLNYYWETIKGHAQSIQVGDFGLGFVPLSHLLELDEREPYHRFYRGNHDNPAIAKELRRHIASGPYTHGTFVLGGAWSIDQAHRTEGLSWWRDEQHSVGELRALEAAYLEQRPHTVLTHDAPTLVAYHMFLKNRLGQQALHLNKTAERLQRMFEQWQPQRWFFGHWHETTTLTLEGTKFQCIGANEHLDVDW